MVLRDTCTRLRGTVTTGPYGSEEIDWTAPAELTLPCEFQPLVGIEDVSGQQRTESQWRVFLEADADVTATDRIRFNGVVYEIIMQPERWRFGGTEHHVELRVELVSGG